MDTYDKYWVLVVIIAIAIIAPIMAGIWWEGFRIVWGLK